MKQTFRHIFHHETVTPLLIFLFLCGVYFATLSGITSSNDGSHYALTRTMVENGRFTLNQFDDYAEGNDIALVGDKLYSDRPPGNALAAALFYTAAGPLPAPPAPLPSRHDAENPRLLYVLLLPVLAGAGTAVLLYTILRAQAIPRPAAVLATLFFALGTAHWKYSTVLFSHALSSFLILLSVYLAWRWSAESPARERAAYGLLGGLLGFSVLVEYSNGLLVLIITLYLVWMARPFTPAHLHRRLLPYAAAGLLSAAFLAFYNNSNFGSPFTLSYSYAVNYPWAGDFRSTFSTPLRQGLQAMLFFGESGGWCGGPCYNQGFLLLSPLLWAALPGLFLFWRRDRRAFLLVNGIFLTYLLLFAKHHTAHGFTGDGRYLVPFLPLLAISLGHTLGALQARGAWWGWTAVAALFALSLRNIFLHIGTSYNYNLNLTQLDPLVAHPRNISYLLQTVFPNGGNWPVFLILAIFVTGLTMIRFRRR
jgi:hypothetical protein